MSIDNMLAAIREAEDSKEAALIIARHLTPQNGFYVRGVPAYPGFSFGLFAIDLNAPSVDGIYARADGYLRFKSVEEVCEFLAHFIPQAELEKALKEFGYEKLPSV